MRTLVVGTMLLIGGMTAALACGTERWPVKVGSDRDAPRVSIQPIVSTVAALIAITPPRKPNLRTASRFPTEFKTYRVSGTLTVIKGEGDDDYHLVIKDKAGHTMIVESPSPKCDPGSVFAHQITVVRAAIDARFGKVSAKRRPNVAVTVTGVAFFDPLHGQEGVAPNGIELHPILAISFR